ncbi:MAG: GAF domain-containing protein [Anaerolineae bacterium]|nr:GAF domain-containing protein [Anaerolineae bacterium]
MSEEKVEAQSGSPYRADPQIAGEQMTVELPEFESANKTMPNGLTVRQKLLVAIGIIGLTLLVVAITGRSLVISLAGEFEVLAAETLEEERVISQLIKSSLALLNETREYSIERNEATLEQIANANGDLTTALQSYGALDNLQREFEDQPLSESLFEEIGEDVSQLQSKSEEIVLLLDSGNTDDEELEEAFEALEDAEINLGLRLEQAEETLQKDMFTRINEIGSQIDMAELLIIFLPLLAFCVFLGIFYFLNRSIVHRLTALEAVTQRISAGELNISANVDSRDEIGKLAYAFNIMTDRLRGLVGNLEEKVAERTYQLETVVEVSQKLSSILDLSDLMHEVVYLTKETFNYYHVHIYLLDELGESLVMVEGYGEAGAEMKKRGHSILLAAPRSLVARAAREGNIISIDNVRKNPHWLPNPLLPETRSEAAVPIYLGSEIVGVLDVQSDHIAGITPASQRILRALASQIATAVGNSRLFSRTQAALVKTERLQSLYTGDAWQRLTKSINSNFEINRSGSLPPLSEKFTPEAEAALQQRQTINLKLNNLDEQKNEQDVGEAFNEKAHSIATPLMLRNQIIGVLGLQDNNPNRRWTSEEIALIEAVSEQMSLALENARLFEETSRRASRERLVADVTQQVWSADEIEAVMRAAVTELGEKLQASEVIIRLGTEADSVSF